MVASASLGGGDALAVAGDEGRVARVRAARRVADSVRVGNVGGAVGVGHALGRVGRRLGRDGDAVAIEKGVSGLAIDGARAASAHAVRVHHTDGAVRVGAARSGLVGK